MPKAIRSTATLLSVSLLTWLALCFQIPSQSQAAGGPVMDDEEYDILSAAINGMFFSESKAADPTSAGEKGHAESSELVVLSDHTIKRDVAGDFVDRIAGRWMNTRLDPGDAAIAQFRIRNASPRPLQRRLSLSVKYTLITRRHFDRLFEGKGPYLGWNAFDKEFPNSVGCISVSRPGLNSTHDRALLYIDRKSGGLSGEGDYLILVKSGGAWSIGRKDWVWMADLPRQNHNLPLTDKPSSAAVCR